VKNQRKLSTIVDSRDFTLITLIFHSRARSITNTPKIEKLIRPNDIVTFVDDDDNNRLLNAGSVV